MPTVVGEDVLGGAVIPQRHFRTMVEPRRIGPQPGLPEHHQFGPFGRSPTNQVLRLLDGRGKIKR